MNRRPRNGLGLRPGRLLLVLVVLAVVGAACSVGEQAEGGDETGGQVAVAPPPEVYVAVGGADALGAGSDRPLNDAWPRRFYRTLGRGAVFVNAAVTSSTVGDARREQVPVALEMDATLVTVWLGTEDLRRGVPTQTYERQLARLVASLRQDGRARVLLGNLPPAEALSTLDDRLRALSADEPPDEQLVEDVASYNRAVARVAAAEGAELVDLHAVFRQAAVDGVLPTLVTEEGAPSAAGHARIAEVFAAQHQR